MIPAIIAGIAAIAAAATKAGLNHKAAEDQKELAQQIMDKYANLSKSNYGQDKAGTFTPTQYELPENIDFKTMARDPQSRAQLMRAIEQMYTMGNENATSQADLERKRYAFEEAADTGNRLASIREAMQARGQGGSGLEYGMMGAATQAGANRRMLAGLASANNAQNERLNALRAYQNSLLQNENVDLGIQRENVDTTNRFNTMNAERRRQTRNANVDMGNQAQQYNIENNKWDLNRKDRHEDTWFQQELAKIRGQETASKDKADANYNQMAGWGQFANSTANAIGNAAGAYAAGGGGGSGGGQAPSSSMQYYDYANDPRNRQYRV